MAVVNVTPTFTTRTGSTLATIGTGAANAAVTPDLTQTQVPNSGNTFLILIVGATPANATVTPVTTVDGLVPTARTFTGLANKTYVIGPFPQGTYGTVLNPQFTNATTITVQALDTSSVS